MFSARSFCLFALVTTAGTACVKPGQVRESQPAPTLNDLCQDARLRSLCTPAPSFEPAPIRVDTNLATPRPARAFG